MAHAWWTYKQIKAQAVKENWFSLEPYVSHFFDNWMFFAYFQILVCFSFSVLSNMAHMSSTVPKSFQQMMLQMETSCCSLINSLCKSSSSTTYLIDPVV